MFFVVYEFKVKAGKDREFKEAWAEVTEAIVKHCGGLGSRLHKAEQDGIYIAYAQWPSRESYFDDSGTEKFTPEENQEREKMKAATVYTKTVYLMEVVNERLKS